MPETDITTVAPPIGTYAYIEASEIVRNSVADSVQYSLTGLRWRPVPLASPSFEDEQQWSDYRTREQVLWGPTLIDEQTLEAMRQVQEAGYQPLPAAPLPLQDA